MVNREIKIFSKNSNEFVLFDKFPAKLNIICRVYLLRPEMVDGGGGGGGGGRPAPPHLLFCKTVYFELIVVYI